jgi:hypothetical protein
MGSDIARVSYDSKQLYRSVVIQQGRVTLEADWNEEQAIAGEELRQQTLEIIGPAATPDNAYQVLPPINATPFNFSVRKGTMYVGGVRVQLDAQTDYLNQPDWLDFWHDPDFWVDPSKLSPPPTTEWVYLFLHEQEVSAVEDMALREVALGGADTAARTRIIQHIVRLASQTKDCTGGLDAGIKAWAALGLLFDSSTMRLLPQSTLRVSFPPAPTPDPCKPEAVGGYLGADNQLIRVQISGPNRLLWGYDDASFLYRVDIDSARKTLHLQSRPIDAAHQPQANQAVEVLSSAAKLANGEYVASAMGVVQTLNSAYNTDSQSITLPNALPPEYGDSTLTPRAFLRVWQQELQFTPGTPLALGDTGVLVTLNNPPFTLGEYWQIAVRPSTPTKVYPQRYLDGLQPPDGPRLWVCPLAAIEWDNGVLKLDDDCRKHFCNLVEACGREAACCSLTVSPPGTTSGDFTSIQQAIDALPASGGEICVLRGSYTEAITLENKRDVVIHGCGSDTRIIAPDGAQAAFSITDSQQITLRDLAIESLASLGVLVAGESSEIKLQSLAVLARDHSAILAKVAKSLSVEECTLGAASLASDLVDGGTVGLDPLLYAAGDGLLIERNVLECEAEESDRRRASGGMQIGGGSANVEIRQNLIRRGNGNGITLGSISYLSPADVNNDALIANLGGARGGAALTRFAYFFDQNNCIFIPGDPQDPTSGGTPLIPVSDGDLYDIRIIENEIEQMGQNGIAVARLSFPDKNPDLITIQGLTICDNMIVRCMQLEVGTISLENLQLVAFGGIILADVEIATLRGNTIEYVGDTHRDPICGLFITMATGVTIEGNRLRHNGMVAVAQQPLKLGNRGGILIRFARAPSEPLTIQFLSQELSGQRQDGMPASVLRDNVVVAREGRALFLVALGPVSVNHNQFTAHGSDFRALLASLIGSAAGRNPAMMVNTATFLTPGAKTLDPLLDALGANAVLIFDLGWSNELYLQLGGLSGKGQEGKWFIGGNILFNNNQVVFDALATITFSLCAVLLFTFDTVTMSSNQFECDLLIDFVILDVLVIALSTEITTNRFTEGIFNCFLSALTVGILLNSTGLNVGTHCIIDLGIIKPGVLAVAGAGPPQDRLRLNIALIDPSGTSQTCNLFETRMPGLMANWKLRSADVGYVAANQ